MKKNNFDPVKYFKRMETEFQKWLVSGNLIHIFVHGETGARSFTFSPKTVFLILQKNQRLAELREEMKWFNLNPKRLADQIKDIGFFLDFNIDQYLPPDDDANDLIGILVLKQLLASETYKVGLAANKNTYVISYLRSNEFKEENCQYQARFCGACTTNGTKDELMDAALSPPVVKMYLSKQGEYKKSPFMHTLIANVDRENIYLKELIWN